MKVIKEEIEQTKKIFSVLARLIRTGSCTYRTLIYDILGYKNSYHELIDGMEITNTICELEELKKEKRMIIDFLRATLKEKETTEAKLRQIYSGGVIGEKCLLDEILCASSNKELIKEILDKYEKSYD